MDRYKYIIELGEELPPLPDELKLKEHKVKGCMSQVWLIGKHEQGVMSFVADSDAHIVRGLVALTLMMFNDKSPSEIAEVDHKKVLADLGLDKHLSPGRSNGLHSMIAKIRNTAASHA